MGNTIVDLAKEKKDFTIVAGFGEIGGNEFSFPLYSNFNSIKEDFDVILDFSYHDLITDILNFSISKNKPLVIATTGYTNKQISEIEKASKEIPILFSGNMSVGINLLLNVVENLSKSLPGYDIEIIEKHHNLKKDSPSGTARMLFNSVNKGRGNSLKELNGREGSNLVRDTSEVGIHAIRGGTIVGEHTVMFSGLDEVLEVTHIAQSKKIFANGGLTACEFIRGKEAGLYNMKDIFKF